jgi:hypothetical protein
MLNSLVCYPANVGNIPSPLFHTLSERSDVMKTTRKVGERNHGELVLEKVDHEIEVEDDLAGYPSPQRGAACRGHDQRSIISISCYCVSHTGSTSICFEYLPSLPRISAIRPLRRSHAPGCLPGSTWPPPSGLLSPLDLSDTRVIASGSGLSILVPPSFCRRTRVTARCPVGRGDPIMLTGRLVFLAHWSTLPQ